MIVDGGRALIVGDYFTPREGEHSGQLGPWSRVVDQIGIPPRSTAMKWVFVAIGAIHLAAAVSMIVAPGTPLTWIAVFASISGLWYLPFGTALDLAALILISTLGLGPWA